MKPVETLTLVPLGVLVVVFGLFPGLLLDLIQGPSSTTALPPSATRARSRSGPLAVTATGRR